MTVASGEHSRALTPRQSGIRQSGIRQSGIRLLRTTVRGGARRLFGIADVRRAVARSTGA